MVKEKERKGSLSPTENLLARTWKPRKKISDQIPARKCKRRLRWLGSALKSLRWAESRKTGIEKIIIGPCIQFPDIDPPLDIK